MNFVYMIKKSLAMLIVSSPLIFSGLEADTINLTSVTGVWNNAQGSSGLPSNFTGGGTNVIHWGFPATDGGQNSGYQFIGTAPPTISNIQLDTPFALGTFTHFNFPISGDSLTSVDLNVSVALTINGTPTNFSGVYHFLHNETPNSFTPVTNPGNDDIVTFQNNISQSGTIVIGGINYSIGLIGFSLSPGSPLVQQFNTVETMQNNATLFAQISRPEVFVPEPSTYLMMGSFLVACAGVAFYRKRKSTLIVDVINSEK